MTTAAPPHGVAHDGHLITQTHADVTRDVVGTLAPASRGYVLLLLGAVSLFLIGLLTFLMLIKDGLGHAGYQPPIFWSVYITTFVFWVGIGHAGTLISAILFLFRSPWRTAVYRSTEVMTVFAVMTAGLFPIIHIGRQWIFYWLLPYPNSRYLWPNFKSPLLWDVLRRAGGGGRSTSWSRSAGAVPTTSGGIIRGPISISPPWPLRWSCRCTRWCRGTSP
jgi:hypothetical protein